MINNMTTLNKEDIPRIIHYCWFGKGKKPRIIKKCIKSWKKYCPDYKIIEWNEDNYDIERSIYCKTAYEQKKWAFVSDYVRLDVLYKYGGIYMDTDVELVKPLDPFLKNNCFLGFQHERYVSNGLVTGTVKENSFIAENLAKYENISFKDDIDSKKLVICQEYTTEILKKYGLLIPCDGTIQHINDIVIYPPEYFCPYDHRKFVMNKTKNTVAIHHFASSWWDKKRIEEYNKIKRIQKFDYYVHIPNRILISMLGKKKYETLKIIVKGIVSK